jgi:hypothetical protein
MIKNFSLYGINAHPGTYRELFTITIQVHFIKHGFHVGIMHLAHVAELPYPHNADHSTHFLCVVMLRRLAASYTIRITQFSAATTGR